MSLNHSNDAHVQSWLRAGDGLPGAVLDRAKGRTLFVDAATGAWTWHGDLHPNLNRPRVIFHHPRVRRRNPPRRKVEGKLVQGPDLLWREVPA